MNRLPSRTIELVIAAMLGLITAISLAVANALVMSMRDARWVDADWWNPTGYALYVNEHRKPGMCRREVSFMLDRWAPNLYEEKLIAFGRSGGGLGERRMYPWEWGIAGRLGRDPEAHTDMMRRVFIEDGRGFPFICL